MISDTERINYVITESGTYVGSFVNHSIVAEGETLEDLDRKAKILFKRYLKHLMELAEQKEPFDFKEITYEEWYAQK